MAVKCGECGKFVSAVDTVRCSKCSVSYHRVCVALPTRGPIVSAWHCPECRKNVRRDNKAETPVLGCVADEESTPATTQLSAVAPLTPQSFAAPSSPVNTESPSDVGSALRLVVEEIRTLRFEVSELRKDVAELKASTDSCHTRMDGIESRLAVLEKRHDAGCDPTANLNAVESVVSQLKRDLNDRDQELMANDLVIGNIPESQAESPAHLFQLIATKLGVTLEDRDIVSAERVGGRHVKATSPRVSTEPRPRAIMVRLARRDLRDAVLNGARVRRDATTENLGLSGRPVRFFVNERLTRSNQQLFRQTRAAAGIHGWRFVWTKRGRILVRQKPGEATHRIASEDDINQLIGPLADTVK